MAYIPKPKRVIICEACGVHFENAHPHVRTCSPECYRTRQRILAGTQVFLKKCATCSKSFAGTKRQAFCSYKCRMEENRQRNKLYISGRKWEILREQVLEEQDYKCIRCNSKQSKKRKLVVHHKIPVIDGGTHERDNLEGVCLKCHAVKHKELFNDRSA